MGGGGGTVFGSSERSRDVSREADPVPELRVSRADRRRRAVRRSAAAAHGLPSDDRPGSS